MQILLIMLIVVLLAFTVLLLALAKQSPREKQTEDKGRIHQGLCRNSKTDRRKYEEVRTLESNCDISDHL